MKDVVRLKDKETSEKLPFDVRSLSEILCDMRV